MEFNHVVGIDLGTTTTLACYMRSNKPEFVRFPGAKNMLPSVIFVNGEGKIFVGKKAVNLGVTEPWNMIRSAKTFIGDSQQNKTWTCGGKKFNPTEVATEVLKEVRAHLIKTLTQYAGYRDGEEIGAVITIPAYFDSNQTDETKKAGEAAGFKIIQIVTEPMAAAVAAIHETGIDKKVFVLDLGGGTFDLSVLEANPAKHTYRALAIGGDKKLGGDDFDQAIAKFCHKIVRDDTNIDLSSLNASKLEQSEYLKITNNILTAARKAKEDLSEDEETDISIGNLIGDYNFGITLSREELNEICGELFQRIENKIHEFLEQYKNTFTKADIGKIILAGSSCHILHIQDIVEKIFGFRADAQLPLGELVAMGACHVAEANNGIETADKKIIVEDILSHSMGVEIFDGDKLILSKILLKNTPYPCRATEHYTTTYDNQKEVHLNIYEVSGDEYENSPETKFHNLYGHLILDDIEIARARVPDIAVTFSYDKSRTLTVTAKDSKTDAEKTVAIKKGEKIKLTEKQSPIDFVILLDSSGSMSGEEMVHAKKACHALVDEMIDFSVHRMALISFDDVPVKQSGLTHNKNHELQGKIDNVQIGGMTNMYDAFKMAYKELQSSSNERVIIMVTDGYPNEMVDETLTYAKDLLKKNVRVVAIGAGDLVNVSYLGQLVGKREDVYKIQNMAALQETFKTAIARITKK